MKRLLLVALVVLAATGVTRAQEDSAPGSQTNPNAAAGFANNFTAMATTANPDVAACTAFVPRSADDLALADPAAAEPPAPTPRYVYGNRDDFRWQLGLGLAIVRFRSSYYYATGIGSNTSLTYFTNEWLGVEGNINTGFAPTIYGNEHVKYASYGAGPKVAWRHRQLEPWAHTLVGGAHILPQTAGHSQNGFSLQVGGGVDYRIFPHLSARAELDWVKTHLFGVWQNNAQANVDIVLHF